METVRADTESSDPLRLPSPTTKIQEHVQNDGLPNRRFEHISAHIGGSGISKTASQDIEVRLSVWRHLPLGNIVAS